jgi:hypothetical protein
VKIKGKMAQLMVGMDAIAQMEINYDQLTIGQTFKLEFTERGLSSQKFALLLQNCQLTRKIAAKVGIQLSDYAIPTNPNPFYVNQHLILLNRTMLIKIASNLGTMVPVLPQLEMDDAIAKNHLLLLGNRRIIKAIALRLNIGIPGLSLRTGTISEQNYQIIAATQIVLKAILAQTEARMP